MHTFKIVTSLYTETMIVDLKPVSLIKLEASQFLSSTLPLSAMLQSCSQQTNGNFIFFKDSPRENFLMLFLLLILNTSVFHAIMSAYNNSYYIIISNCLLWDLNIVHEQNLYNISFIFFIHSAVQ